MVAGRSDRLIPMVAPSGPGTVRLVAVAVQPAASERGQRPTWASEQRAGACEAAIRSANCWRGFV